MLSLTFSAEEGLRSTCRFFAVSVASFEAKDSGYKTSLGRMMSNLLLRHGSGAQIWYRFGGLIYILGKNGLTRVGVGDTRLISTFSADEILRSVQRGGETVLSLIRLALVSW